MTANAVRFLAAALLLCAALLPRAAEAQTTPPAPPTATPTVAPTGEGSGKIVAGSVPSNGGFGLIVYGGGTYAQLVTATGCPDGQVAFWATRDGEFVVYVPTTAVAAVNAGFQAAFPGDSIPANTPLIGRCLPAALSGIEGTVTRGPVCAVPAQGGSLLPCPGEPYQATLVFLDSQAREVARVTSGPDGRYRTALAPGRYTVLPLSPPAQTFPRASSVEATVTAGQFTTVDIAYDTGIRPAR